MINNTAYSLHQNYMNRISIFASHKDCPNDIIMITHDTSDEDVECVIKCVCDEEYTCNKDVKSFTDIHRFVSYIGPDEILTERIFKKINRNKMTMIEFVEAFKNYADTAETKDLLRYYVLMIKANTKVIMDNRQLLIDIFSPNMRLFIMRGILEDKYMKGTHHVDTNQNKYQIRKTVSIEYFDYLEETVFGTNTKKELIYESNMCSFFADEIKICETELDDENKEVDITATIAYYCAKLLMESDEPVRILMKDSSEETSDSSDTYSY